MTENVESWLDLSKVSDGILRELRDTLTGMVNENTPVMRDMLRLTLAEQGKRSAAIENGVTRDVNDGFE